MSLDSERKPENGSPEVKKRKPGRPRKGTPTRTTGVTGKYNVLLCETGIKLKRMNIPISILNILNS